MKYHFQINKEERGYSAKCLELDGCITEGDTLEELEINMSNVLNLYLDEPQNSSRVFDYPNDNYKGDSIVEVRVLPEVAFGVILKHLRNKHNMTQQEVANKLGFKRIYGYQRYERKSNPKISTVGQILKVFPDFPLELLF